MSTVILALIVTLLTDKIVNICLYKRSSPRFELDELKDLCGETSSLVEENISKAYVLLIDKSFSIQSGKIEMKKRMYGGCL